MTTKTRPAAFNWTSNFNADGCRERIYRLREDASTRVLDANGGEDPGRDRHRVRATVVDEWNGRKSEWVVWTKGFSNHGNARTRRTFATLQEAERHINRWAARRWRVEGDGA